MITGNILGYQISALSEKRLYASNPSTVEMLPETFVPATTAETDRAVRLAAAAFRTYRNLAGTLRAAFLTAIADGIEHIGETLVQRMMEETGYPQPRVIVERNRTCSQLRMFAEIAASEQWREIVVDPALPDRTPTPRPDLRSMMVPLGPIVVFGAANFPLAYSTAGGDVASALAVGCPVIVKAHDAHLGTHALVAEVIMNAARQTDMPEGVFSALVGDGYETGRQLVLHPDTAAVGFTGSQQGGRALFDLGHQREKPIPVFAEMGSVNPVFLLPGAVAADVEALAKTLAGSIALSVGQFCTQPGILVALRNSDTVHLLDMLKIELEKMTTAPMLHTEIYRSFHNGIESIRNHDGLNMICDVMPAPGLHTSPVLATVDATNFLNQPQLHLEVFGPFSLCVLCSDPDQMEMVASSLDGQLTATIHAAETEHNRTSDLMEVLSEKAGRIVIKGVPTGVEVCGAMTHGGPYPASTDSRFTAVGARSVRRWVRPVTYQNVPSVLLPELLKML